MSGADTSVASRYAGRLVRCMPLALLCALVMILQAGCAAPAPRRSNANLRAGDGRGDKSPPQRGAPRAVASPSNSNRAEPKTPEAAPRTEVRLVAFQPATGSAHARVPAASPPVRPENLPPVAGTALQELTLDQAIQLCLVNDPRIRAGFEAIVQANAGAVTASLKPNPGFFTDGQLLELFKQFTPTRQGGPPQQDFQVSYPIDWFLFGKRAAAMASAAQGVSVSQAEYENLIRERVAAAMLAYYDVAEAENLLKLARQDVESFQRIETSTRSALELGGRPEVELNRIRLERLARQRQLREAEAASATTKSALNALLGGALTNLSFTTARGLSRPIAFELPSTETAFNTAIQNRPDLSALRRRIAKARSDVIVEDRKAHPDVTTTFGYTRQYQFSTIGFPDADSFSASVAFPLPFWDRNQGNRRAARSVAAQSRFELEAGEVELWAEIETVLAELAAARDNAAAVAEQELRLAEQVRDSVSQGYSIGGRSLIELLDAQQVYRETYRAYATTRANYWRARARYQSAIAQEVTP